MDRSGLISRIKVKLDEFTPDEGVNHPFDTLIEPMLDEAANEIINLAPLYLFVHTGLDDSGAIYANSFAYIEIPANFIRLARVKYPAWEKAVTEAISIEHPDYKIFDNPYLRGGTANPKVAIVDENPDITYGKYLKCYKVADGVQADEFTYIAQTSAQDIPNKVVDALTWLCALKIAKIADGFKDKIEAIDSEFQKSLLLIVK